MTACQLALDLPLRPALGYDDFLIAPSNTEAAGWIDRWPKWPGRLLALHGPEGCGKTHLVHVWRAMANARIIANPALMDHNPLVELGPSLCVALEHFPAHGDQEKLLHLINWVGEQNGSLLLTGRQAPARWPVELRDLRSRLRAMQSVALGPPDDHLLGAIMVKLFDDRQVGIGQEVITYLLSRIERSFAGARRAVDAIDGLSLALKRRITVPLARAALDQADDRL